MGRNTHNACTIRHDACAVGHNVCTVGHDACAVGHDAIDAPREARCGETRNACGSGSDTKRAERLAELTSELTRRVSLFRLERARFDLDLLKKGLGGLRQPSVLLPNEGIMRHDRGIDGNEAQLAILRGVQQASVGNGAPKAFPDEERRVEQQVVRCDDLYLIERLSGPALYGPRFDELARERDDLAFEVLRPHHLQLRMGGVAWGVGA